MNYEKNCIICPTCKKPGDKEDIEDIGECLRCDHVRGNVQDDQKEEVLNE